MLIEMSGDLDDDRSDGSTLLRRLTHRRMSRDHRNQSAADASARVLIVIATDAVGGPGKGLLQFLKYVPESFEYVLCNFDVRNSRNGQFIQEALHRKLNLALLKQWATFDPTLILQARRIVLTNRIDIIQTHGYKAAVLGFFLRALCRRPWIGFAHGYTADNWKMRIYNRIDRRLLRYADRVVTVSESLTQLMVGHGVRREKIRAIHNAVEADDTTPARAGSEVRAEHGIAPTDLVLGVIGRLNPEKGQLVFLKAMAATVRRFPNAKALLVGDGQDRPMLEAFCRDHGLADRVVFAGYQKDVASYYQILDLLVLPSRSEGLPNTVLEAMAWGVPVLATSVGGVPEIIREDNGVLVPHDDPDALAARMVELLGDEPLRRRIGALGRQSLHPRFAPEQRVRDILALYEEVLAASPRRVVRA